MSSMSATCDTKQTQMQHTKYAQKTHHQAGEYHYLGNKNDNLFNESIYILAKIIKNVMSSAVKSEVAGLFMNPQHTLPI